MAQVGERQVHLQSRALVKCYRACNVRRPVVRDDTGVDDLTVLSRAGFDPGAIGDPERQLRNAEIGVGVDTIGIETIEKVFNVAKSTDSGKVIGPDSRPGSRQIDRLWIARWVTLVGKNEARRHRCAHGFRHAEL